jgi:hypothetical protein
MPITHYPNRIGCHTRIMPIDACMSANIMTRNKLKIIGLYIAIWLGLHNPKTMTKKLIM